MKNSILLFSFLTSCLSGIYAQKDNLKIGFVGGVGLSTFTNKLPNSSPNSVNNLLLGLNFGITAQKALKENLSVNVGLGLTQKGDKLKFDNFTIVHKNSYVNLPILLNYRVKKIYLETGPELGYLFDNRILFNNKKSPITLDNRKFDVSANIGLGFWLTQQSSISVRVSKGFFNTSEINLTDENGNFLSTNWVEKNLAFQTLLTYYLF
jgi:hypothetical protein